MELTIKFMSSNGSLCFFLLLINERLLPPIRNHMSHHNSKHHRCVNKSLSNKHGQLKQKVWAPKEIRKRRISKKVDFFKSNESVSFDISPCAWYVLNPHLYGGKLSVGLLPTRCVFVSLQLYIHMGNVWWHVFLSPYLVDWLVVATF